MHNKCLTKILNKRDALDHLNLCVPSSSINLFFFFVHFFVINNSCIFSYVKFSETSCQCVCYWSCKI